MFVMVFACGVFAYTMNTMGTMLQQIDSFSEEFKNEMIAVNRYLKNKQIPMDMQMRIRKYLEYIYERS
jgi:hyperpolarization activated cyclic nucleotide-gated potassium channel 2